VVWGVFHVSVAHDIYQLGAGQSGIAQGRLYQLAAYMLSIALFAIATAVLGNWRESERAHWLNLCVVGWADGIWLLVDVFPGYVPFVRGIVPPIIFLLAAAFTSWARLVRSKQQSQMNSRRSSD
jgi:uncharacterized membrane protein